MRSLLHSDAEGRAAFDQRMFIWMCYCHCRCVLSVHIWKSVRSLLHSDAEGRAEFDQRKHHVILSVQLCLLLL